MTNQLDKGKRDQLTRQSVGGMPRSGAMTKPTESSPARVDRLALADRIEALARDAGSGRELGRRAGLKSDRHVSFMIQRFREQPSAGVELSTLEALAEGAGVALCELLGLTPTGTQADALPGWASAEEEARGRYPTIRARAWELARRVGLPEPVRPDAAFVAGLARLLDDAQPA